MQRGLVNVPTAGHLALARSCLSHEGALGGEGSAVARAHGKLRLHMSPLIGEAGFEMLFTRSAKLARGELAWMADISILDGAPRLRAALDAQKPALSAEGAVTLFATFFSLLTTFIGERLTVQVVRRAWPELDYDTVSTERSS